MVRQPIVHHVDCRQRSVVTSADDVECSTLIVRGAADELDESVAGYQLNERNGVWIRLSFESDVNVPCQHERVC